MSLCLLFSMGAGNLNSGPYIYTASTLSTEPFSQLPDLYLYNIDKISILKCCFSSVPSILLCLFLPYIYYTHVFVGFVNAIDFTISPVHSEPRRGLNKYLMNQLIILSKLVSDFTTYQDRNLQCLHEYICLCICLGRVASCIFL